MRKFWIKPSFHEQAVTACSYYRDPGDAVSYMRMFSFTQQHYHKLIVDRLEPQIIEWQKNLFRFFDDAPETITNLSKQYELGIIANQTVDSLKLLL